MKNFKSLLSILLALVMIVGIFASCKSNAGTTTDSTGKTTSDNATEDKESETPTESEKIETSSESEFESKSESESESDSDSDSDNETEGESGSESDSETVPAAPFNDDIVENANGLAEQVNSYFDSANREYFIMENNNMTMKYSLKASSKQLVSSLCNSQGKPYVLNTMDAYYKKKDGTISFASNSTVNTQSNIYRFGYYYFENRLEGQVFMSDDFNVTSSTPIDLNDIEYSDQVKTTYKNDVLTIRIEDTADPRVSYKASSLDCNALKITVKAGLSDGAKESITFFLQLTADGGYAQETQITLQLINDGEYHTYYVPLTSVSGFVGEMHRVRIDPNGNRGDRYEISDFEYAKLSTAELSLARSVLVYSDKMHQILQFTATNEVKDIAELGMLTHISADTVEKLVVKDKNGIHYKLSGVHWASAEYIGFDIKDVGIFGYILPDDKLSGKMEVTLENGVYTIRQYATPRGYTIYPSEKGTNNGNDYYMGQRIYTDETHDFSAFLLEAHCERNPLTDKNIIVDKEHSESGSFIGYDALRGIYKLGVKSVVFSGPFERFPNRHFPVNFTVTGDDYNRRFYIMTYSTTYGCLECAVILDENNMLMPIPVEVGKNFDGDGEANLYNIDDPRYSEAIIPLAIRAGASQELTIVNLYQNWGKYPLKQISWIQYYCPFYHFSTGVTETNCIRQMFDTKGGRELMYLPDHRAWSAPFWHELEVGNHQPQHTNGGHHYFLQYTDADGKYNSIEFVNDKITSYGPTYAEIVMDYITDDRKMEVTHTHMEMPQDDENRTYYTIEYKVLEDISIKDFKQNFSIYSVREKGTGSYYRNIGYLDKDNKHSVADSIAQTKDVEDGTQQVFELGNIAPYFTFFNVPDYVSSDGVYGYVNVSFLIGETEITINGETYEPKFLLYNEKVDGYVYLRLTLDLEDVVLKAGDTFKLNAIILPWGSHLLNNKYDAEGNLLKDGTYYDTVIDEATGEKYLTKNVRDVRENSIINPFVGKAVKDCTVLDTAFMPQFRTQNGKSAEFTIEGGENNVATRVYGFNMLTVPKIEELVDGKWVDYEVCSVNTPDQMGYAHSYDGYMVYYDEDGTYSYSFVTTITDGAPRTFRVTADTECQGFPDEAPIGSGTYDPNGDYRYFFEAESLFETAVDHANRYSNMLINNDSVAFYGSNKSGEAALFPISNGTLESGQYLAIKYRYPKTNVSTYPNKIELFTSTVNDAPVAGDGFYASVEADGEWHILLIDLAKAKTANGFTPEVNGKYMIKYLRIDILNQVTPTTDCIEIGYIATFTEYDKAIGFDKTVKYVTVDEAGVTKQIDPSTGEEYVVKYNQSADYHDSTVAHATCLEALNGKQLAGGLGGSLTKGPEIMTLNSTTISDSLLVITGWTVVEGGFSKIVWSADGGLTWNDAEFYRLEKFGDGGSDHIKVAEGRLNNTYTFVDRENSIKGITYQGGRLPYYHDQCAGVAADLSAYIGQTVDVTFAAIPNSDSNGLCYITLVKSVNVVEPGSAEEEPVDDEYNKVSSGYVVSKISHATCLDGVNGFKLSGKGGNSIKGPEIYALDSTTIGNSQVVLSGWTVVEGGFDRIVWSADGGLTWNNASLYGRDSFGNGSAEHIKVAQGRLNNTYTFVDTTGSITGCSYAGSLSTEGYSANTHGVAADLSAYIGQTVSVTFAAVPKGQPNSLCYIAHITGVQVVEGTTAQ